MVDTLGIGGAEWHVVDLARGLRRAGYEVEVACSAGGELASYLDEGAVTHHAWGVRRVRRRVSLKYAWWLRRLIYRGGFDLVHAHLYASEVAAALAVSGTAARLVVTEHSEGKWMGTRQRLSIGWAQRRAEAVIAVASCIAKQVDDKSATVFTVPAWPCLRAEQRDATPAGGGAHVGVVARLYPEKGVDVLLAAAGQILRHLPAAHFSIVGDGPLRETLQRQAAVLGIADAVRFLGLRPDGPSLIAGFDVLAVPSRSEGVPRVILEAMRAGVPVVASAVGGIPDVVQTDGEGILVPPDDPAALAAAIIRVLTDLQLAATLRAAGLRRAARCDAAGMVTSVMQIYREVLAGASSAPQQWPVARPPDVR